MRGDSFLPAGDRLDIITRIDALAGQLSKSFPLMASGLQIDSLVMARALTNLRNKLLI